MPEISKKKTNIPDFNNLITTNNYYFYKKQRLQVLLTNIIISFIQLISFFSVKNLLRLATLTGFIFRFFYRKKIIYTNLSLAFPEISAKKRALIQYKYYQHLADIIFESVKSISIAPRELKKHLKLQPDSYSILKKCEQSGQHIFVVLGHYGNWEWAALLAGLETKLPSFAVYAPPSNKTFDKFIIKNRSRFGCQLIALNQIKTLYGTLQKEPTLVAFVADQTPVDTDNAYWTKFLNMNTPFFKGFDTLARKANAIVLYASIQKINRGYYELFFEPITDHAAQEKEHYIVEQYVRLLEEDIYQHPEYWLWSHRRWKRAGVNY